MNQAKMLAPIGIVALLVVVGMLAVAAPVLFSGLAWVASLL